MNSLTIIKALCRDCDLAECANTCCWYSLPYETAEEFAKEYFGMKICDGCEVIEGQEYLYVYEVDAQSLWIDDLGKPDCVLERINPDDAAFDDQYLYLWKIE